MSNESTSTHFLEGQCINATNAPELHGWAKSLGATCDEIRNAVEEVGPYIEKVIEHLSKC